MRGAGSSFGWRWLGHALLLRRRQMTRLLLAIAGGYGAGIAFPIATQHIVDAIVSGQADLARMAGLALLAVAAIGIEVGLSAYREKLILELAAFLDRRIARRVFAHLMRVRTDEADFRSGDVLNHFQQITKIREFILYQLPNTVIDLGAAAVALGLTFSYDPLVALTLLAAAPAIVLITGDEIGKIWSLATAHYETISARDGMLAETVSGLPTVKALALEGSRVARWEAVTGATLAALRTVTDLQRRYGIRSRGVSRVMTLLVIGVGCWRLYGGHLTVGAFLAIQVISARVTSPFLGAAEILRLTQEVNVAIRKIGAFLDLPREAADRNPPLRRIGSGGIRLQGVGVTYPGAARPALRDVSAVLPERGIVGIVGRNGSGKSTLLRVLLGLQRDYAGRVEIGGADLRAFDPRWLRGRIGTVDQDTILFSASIADNLGGRRHAPEAMREALRFAGMLDRVDALPQGLGTVLGEGGRTLSGGQRQRLSIARAVVRDPAIALLDEPTAFLDPEAALALERNLIAWGRDRLLILVTHNLGAVRQADRILVLDEGRLIGSGPHADLIRDVPVYARLWRDYTRSQGAEPDRAAEPA